MCHVTSRGYVGMPGRGARRWPWDMWVSRRQRTKGLLPYQKKRNPGPLSINRVKVLLRRNQLRATRDRDEPYRTKLGASSLECPASLLQLSVSAAS